ncbi:MAG: hypothetical protein Q9Q40_02625, partial [Acidobacteriota bacterium]|nr:hypothetical protein [Acidobacteriota bacterium]
MKEAIDQMTVAVTQIVDKVVAASTAAPVVVDSVKAFIRTLANLREDNVEAHAGTVFTNPMVACTAYALLTDLANGVITFTRVTDNVTELTRSLVATYYESFAAGKQPSDESLTKLSRDMAEPLRALGYAV